MDKSRSYGRRVLRGIAHYVELHGPWSLSVDPHASGAYNVRWLKNWRGDGVLAFVEALPAAGRLRASGLPIVELFGHRLDLNLPQVSNDEAAIGRLAAEHLLERQFRRFAFVGYSGLGWSERRQGGFVERARQAGLTVETLFCGESGRSLATWEQDQRRLTEWLARLAKPVGVMACSDRLGTRVLDACRRADLAVPEEVAVIGVDNDEETCLLGHPPLSSVIDDAEQVGFAAAHLLDEMMAGRDRGRRQWSKPILIPPVGVATRRSTEVAAIEDAVVARAARLI
ncbi:MAG: XylR family transcriptional regulator, partial [Vicinamibacteraceae bacterium]